ncbi:MAG: hypothetical protein JKY56_07215 [Kofleriaceae bacterium]|nr:hypothetical protein [Kofleriaceae bacterium]
MSNDLRTSSWKVKLRTFVARPSFAFFAISLLAYSYFYQAGGWNQNVRFDLVRSLTEQRSVVIDDYRRNSGDLSCYGDKGVCKGVAKAVNNEHYYCDKAPGVSLLGVVPYVAIYALAGDDKPSANYLRNSVYLSTIVSVALPSAFSVAFLFALLLALRFSRWTSSALAFGYGFSTLAFPYSTLLYGHQTAAALLFIGFALLVRARHNKSDPPMFLVGLCLGFSVVCEYPAALAVIPISVYAAVYFRPWKRLLGFVLGGALCIVILTGYHWVTFGGPLTLPYEFSTQHFRSLGIFMGLGAPNWPAFSNTMFTSYRGLFFSAPWLLLAFPGAYFMIRKSRLRAEAIVSLSVFLLFLWMTSSLIDSWHGGWSMGARYMIPAIPFLVFLIAGLALPRTSDDSGKTSTDKAPIGARKWLRPGIQVLLALAIGYSALLMLSAAAVRPEVPQQIKEPFAKYLTPHFYAGELSLNAQGIDMVAPPRGKPKPRAWNLGHKLGLTGLTSLLPLLLAFAVFLGWIALWIRRSRTAHRD